MLERFFVPFMITAIKELKCEHLQFLMYPDLDRLVSSMKLPKNSQDAPDFTKMTHDQYMAFRHAFVQQKLFNKTYMSNEGVIAMEMILTVLVMVLCNKVPKGVVSFRIDPLAHKIRLVSPPRGIEVETRTDVQKTSVTSANPTGMQEVLVEKNTNEKAVVRILVPKRTMTLSEINAEKDPPQTAEGDEILSGDGEQAAAAKEDGDEKKEDAEKVAENLRTSQNKSTISKQPSERIIEQDQDDKAMMIASKINLGTPYQVYVLNQYAARAHRTDFIEQIKRQTYDWFSDNPRAFKKIQEAADAEAEKVENAFIEATCDEYVLPCLDYFVNAPDYE